MNVPSNGKKTAERHPEGSQVPSANGPMGWGEPTGSPTEQTS
jgi:hypothetical protein